MVIAFAAGAASAAAGEVVGSQYAPKVYVFGNDPYGGPEAFTRVSALTIDKSGYYKLTGNGAYFGRVLVDDGVSADILMENLTIDVRGVSGVQNACAFQINPGATVTLRLAGTNSLKSVGTAAAIEVPAGASLIITSAKGDGSTSGSLEAISEKGAGIGGSAESSGSITINGGTVTATGSDGPGIGSNSGTSGAIAINGGTVTASADSNGPGIGGNNNPIINISGGKVTATGKGGKNAGIGGNTNSNTNASIDITGGVVTAEADSSSSTGAGIGGNGGQQIINISGGDVTAKGTTNTGGSAGIGGGSSSPVGTINISGGKVKATGGHGAGIGGGYNSRGGTITISGGVVTATSTGVVTGKFLNGGAGIGGGYSNSNIGGSNITISGNAVVTAVALVCGAGIGGGQNYGNSGNITISGNAVVTATGGSQGAGIGTGYANGSVNEIIINGGVVIASGGEFAPPIGNGNARQASDGTVKLSGGTIFGLTGTPIGQNGEDMSVGSLSISDNAVILAPKGVKDGTSFNGGILVSSDVEFNGTAINLKTKLTVPSGKTLTIPRGYTINKDMIDVKGKLVDMNEQAFVSFGDNGDNGSWAINWGTPIADKVELFNGFYIASGKTLTVPSGKTVIIPSGVKVINDGTIEVNGTLDVKGTLLNRGLVYYKNGTVTGSGIVNAPGNGFGTGGILTQSGSTWTVVSGVAPLPDNFVIMPGQTLSVQSGATAVIRGTATNRGTISTASGGTLLVYGTLTNDSNGTINNDGTLDNKGVINNSGTVMDGGKFINWQGAVVNNIFTSVQTYLGESIPFALIHVTSAGTLDNYGTVNNSGTIWVDGTFNNWEDGAVNNAKNALIRIAGTFTNHGHLKNRGTIGVKDGGKLDNTGTGSIDNTGGTISVDEGGTFTNDGAYTGGGPGVGATDITKGSVTVKDAAGNEITTTARMTLGDDGVWLIKGLPESTDLSAVGLTFTLPSGASISPGNGSLHDFSDGKTVTYRVTSGGSTMYYEVGLRRTGDDDDIPVDPESSTNITKGPVKVLDDDWHTIAEGPMELQSDGTWRIAVPDNEDISNASLWFISALPDENTRVVPEHDVFLDFSGGKIVKYFVISANWENFRAYQIWLSGGLDNDSPEDTSDEGAEGSTDITKGLVTLRDATGETITEAPMQDTGGLWVITVPASTDLSAVALTFTLPHASTIVLPRNGSLQDFSDGKTVLYNVISANGRHVDGYEVKLETETAAKKGTLVDEDVTAWSFTESSNDSGLSFMVEAPMSNDVPVLSIDAVQKVYLGGNYSNVQLVKAFSQTTNTSVQYLTPVLSIAGTAYTEAELEKLSISRVEWTKTDGSKWYQDLGKPVTYADLTNYIGKGTGSGDGGDDGGCGVAAWPFLAILCAAVMLFSRKKGS
jgi:hypothetical protein